MSHGDLLVPPLDAGQQGVVELLVDLEDVLDFVEDGVHLLDGEDGLGGRGRGFEGTHRLVGGRAGDREITVSAVLPTFTEELSSSQQSSVKSGFNINHLL